MDKGQRLTEKCFHSYNISFKEKSIVTTLLNQWSGVQAREVLKMPSLTIILYLLSLCNLLSCEEGNNPILIYISDNQYGYSHPKYKVKKNCMSELH